VAAQAPVTPEPYDGPPPPARHDRPAWLRARGAIAGAAVAVLAAGALGGFALGHTVAGSAGNGDQTGQIGRGFTPDDDHAPPGQPPGGFGDDDGGGYAPQPQDQGGTGGSVGGSETAYRS
jgi:hypothetical protein